MQTLDEAKAALGSARKELCDREIELLKARQVRERAKDPLILQDVLYAGLKNDRAREAYLVDKLPDEHKAVANAHILVEMAKSNLYVLELDWEHIKLLCGA